MSINIKKTKELYNIKHQKDTELEKLKEELINIKQQKDKENNKNTPLNKEYLYDKNFFKNNNLFSNTSLNKLGYELIIYSHILEKGMQHFEIRPFAMMKIDIIINLIKLQSKFDKYKNTFAFINSVNSLREYKKIYENHNWTDREEYKKVNDF